MQTTGFHGTSIHNARRIEASANDHRGGEQVFLVGDDQGGWLGRGVYFWESAPQRAYVWARSRYPVDQVAVIAADIDLTDCLDLFDLEVYRQLKRVYSKFVERESSQGYSYWQAPLTVSGGKARPGNVDYANLKDRPPIRNYRDKQLIDWYVGFLANGIPAFYARSIRGIFLDGSAVYPQSFFFNWSHVQICVIDQDVISNVRIFEYPNSTIS